MVLNKLNKSYSGAVAAFRGYRLQTLFILFSIIKNNDPNELFLPENY